jgi:hypothetical protein
VVGLLTGVRPAAEAVERIWAGAEQLLGSWGN